ncbi:MAG: flavoprotein oxidoreductase [Nitriliruptorales bacterium]|nr:flavoprotein oxidoreductase [Nitriliruptorales bacterium]
MPRLLIVGGDAAGMSAATHVKRACPDVDVVVVERGSYTSYAMCGIPYYVAGEVDEPAQLVAKAPEEFASMGITVHLRTEAVDVDPEGRMVGVIGLDDGEERSEPYDQLLLATGAHPVPQPIPGMAEYGNVVHTLDEGERLRRHLDTVATKQAVVVGAGYIGMEIAESLVRRGIKATLLDRSPQVMRSLDPDMAAHVERALIEFGVDVRLDERMTEIRGTDGVCTEVVTDKGTFEAQAVIMGLGGKPNLELAEKAGCEIGPSGGLVVDPQMRTTVAGVWAAGDCVESVDVVAGLRRNVQLGTHANKQGKIAGYNLAAVLSGNQPSAAFPGVVGTAVTKVCNWQIARTGLLESDALEAGVEYEVVSFEGNARAGYMDDPGRVYVKMMAGRPTGRVLGAQMVGTGNVAKRIDVAATWCHLGVTVQEAQLLDLSYAPPFGGVWDLLQVGARKLVAKLGLQPLL